MAAPGTRFAELRGGAASGAADGPERRCPSCGGRYPSNFVVCPKDATSLEHADEDGDPLLGEILAGTFCITNILGEGGMGKVYEAEHVRLPRRFAIKVMLEELVKHPDAIARFEREAQAVAMVSSEHVIEVVDLVRLKDGRPCLITELLQGQELGALLDELGKLPIPVAVTIGRQVCRGLMAAHGVGVVHRDLKPANLFLVKRSDGLPFTKILDFGVAKLSDGANLTLTGMVVGTPAYMSPEQARGDKTIDERADVYSLGAVIYHMLTGSPPFEGDEPGVVLTRVLTEDPPRPRSLNRAIPDELEHLVQRAMAREAAGRPANAAELEHALAAFEADSAPRAEPSSGPRSMPSVVATAETQLAAPSASKPVLPVAPPRWSRIGAMMVAGGFGIGVGATGFAAIAAGIRIAHPASPVSQTELALVGVVAGIFALAAFVSGIKMIAARWRSAPAIDRIGGALAGGMTAIFAAMGLSSLAWTDVTMVVPDPLPGHILGPAQVGMLVVPLLAGVVVFLAAARRAGRMG